MMNKKVEKRSLATFSTLFHHFPLFCELLPLRPTSKRFQLISHRIKQLCYLCFKNDRFLNWRGILHHWRSHELETHVRIINYAESYEFPYENVCYMRKNAFVDTPNRGLLADH